MESNIFMILVLYFIVGAVITYFTVNTRIESERKNTWLKYLVYLLIVNLLYLSLVFDSVFFHYLSLIIIVFGYFEIIQLTFTTKKVKVGLISLVLFSLVFYGFYRFSLLEKNIIFYVLCLVIVFDAFSQLTGQLIGKTRLFPRISPNKTLEGIIGGYLFSAITSTMIHSLLYISIIESLVLSIFISSFAFLGDISASFVKRKFEVKDFSTLIPGHGGFLDRFDSVIFCGLFMFIIISLRIFTLPTYV